MAEVIEISKPHLCECDKCGSTEFCVETIHGVRFIVCRNCDTTYGEINDQMDNRHREEND